MSCRKSSKVDLAVSTSCCEEPRRVLAPRRDAGATKKPEGRFRSARARGKAGLFPELLPVPDAGNFVENAVTKLVGQHQNLTAMMGLVREHVSEHGSSGGPRWHPTVARKLYNAAIRSGRESVRQHAQALPGASPVRGGSLLHGAAARIESRRTLQMRSRKPEPLAADIV